MKRAIFRDASIHGFLARTLAERHNAPVTIRSIQQLLQEEPTLGWRRPLCKPHLTPRNKLQRRICVGRMAAKQASYWNSLIFTDKRRFFLDGPDVSEKYGHDVRRPRRT